MTVSFCLELDYENEYFKDKFSSNIKNLLSKTTSKEERNFLEMLGRSFNDSWYEESEDEEAAREFLEDIKKHLKKNKFTEVSYSECLENTDFYSTGSKYYQRYPYELSIYFLDRGVSNIIILDPACDKYRIVFGLGMMDIKGSYEDIRQAINMIYGETEILPDLSLDDYYIDSD